MKLKIEDDATKAVEAELAKLPAKPDAIAQETLRSKKMEEAFAAMAREKSVCPSKRDGGDLNWFPRIGSMVEPFAKAAFGLKAFAVSDVITTEFGYHLVMVTARKQGEPTKFETVKDAVREVYGMKLREKVVEMMRKQAKIETVGK
jgi:peptidyl-prolyl cis-trans isomerase C